METIYVITGSGAIQQYEQMGDSIFIGRSPDNAVQVLDVSVSRKHIKISEQDNRIFINDLHSKNGTYINGTQISPGVDFEMKECAPIVIGMSVVCIGKACLDFVMPFVDSLKSPPKEDEINDVGMSFTRSLTNLKNNQLISNVNSILDISRNINEVTENLLNLILDHFLRVDRGVIFLCMEDGEREVKETIVVRSRVDGDEVNKKYSRKIVDRVISSKESVVVLDTKSENDPSISEALKLLKIGSVMCTPLIKDDRIMGALYIDSYNKPYGFREEDLILFNELSDLTANAIETYLAPKNNA
ncbi:FHA domain-containing protein [Thermodesulfobacteriota bacterium]